MKNRRGIGRAILRDRLLKVERKSVYKKLFHSLQHYYQDGVQRKGATLSSALLFRALLDLGARLLSPISRRVNRIYVKLACSFANESLDERRMAVSSSVKFEMGYRRSTKHESCCICICMCRVTMCPRLPVRHVAQGFAYASPRTNHKYFETRIAYPLFAAYDTHCLCARATNPTLSNPRLWSADC